MLGTHLYLLTSYTSAALGCFDLMRAWLAKQNGPYNLKATVHVRRIEFGRVGCEMRTSSSECSASGCCRAGRLSWRYRPAVCDVACVRLICFMLFFRQPNNWCIDEEALQQYMFTLAEYHCALISPVIIFASAKAEACSDTYAPSHIWYFSCSVIHESWGINLNFQSTLARIVRYPVKK